MKLQNLSLGDGPFFYDLATAAAGVGLVSGVSNLLGGGSDAPSYSGAQQQATTPWWQSGGGQAASQRLMELMNGPSGILSDPVFQAFDKYSTDQLQRRMAATGMHQSGAEQAALKQNTMANAGQFYTQQTGLLGSLAGLGFNPASGVQAGMGAAQFGAQQQQAGWGAIGQGLGGLNQIYGTPKTSSGAGLTQEQTDAQFGMMVG